MFVSTGPPGWFVALFVIALVLGVAGAVFRVSMARDMARRSGMDPDEATAMTLLDDDGLGATYLASHLRGSGPAVPAASPTPATRTATERLAELDRLRTSGAIDEQEYAAQRRAIIGSV